MEVRKLDTGSRAWQARPGEQYLATTGEKSRLCGVTRRPPQKIVGVGFTSEGMDDSRPFRRMPDSFHRSVAWMFEGIGPQRDFRRFRARSRRCRGPRDRPLRPHARHAAARADPGLVRRLSPTTIRWCTKRSPTHSRAQAGTQDPLVRADIIYFTTAHDGACLSIGSIAWNQALPCKNGDNNVGRFMRNVLNAFLRPGTPAWKRVCW